MREPDAARRMADALAVHQMALTRDEILAGRYVAIRLADGGSDLTAYDSHAAAVRAHQNSPSRMLYFQIPLERLPPEECDVLLWYQRGVYDAGFRADPSHALILPTRNEDL